MTIFWTDFFIRTDDERCIIIYYIISMEVGNKI